MKTKVIIVVLVLIAVGLMIGLIQVKQQATAQHDEDVGKILYHSNQWSDVNTKLEDEKQARLALEKDVAARREEITKLSNDLSQSSETLTKTEDSLKTALKTSAEEIAKRDAKIAELETEKDNLDKQAVDLKSSIGSLETQIADTKKKLDASEGDKAFLTKELTRMMAEKAELERQFNDLAVLRTQVKKLKEELSVARRVEWGRLGLYAKQDEKGAQKLMQQPSGAPRAAAPKPAGTNAPDLNVEVNSDGSVRVIAPITNTVPPPK